MAISILVVDDSPMARKMLILMAVHLGFPEWLKGFENPHSLRSQVNNLLRNDICFLLGGICVYMPCSVACAMVIFLVGQ